MAEAKKTVEQKQAEPEVGTRAYYEKYPEAPVRFTVPYNQNSDRDDIWVGVNDRTYLMKCGETVVIPWNVAEIVRQQIAQDRHTAKLIGKMGKE